MTYSDGSPAASAAVVFSVCAHACLLLPLSRNGSALVKEVREKKDKDKSRLRFWDMAGSKMGQVTGLTGDEAADAAKRAEEMVRREGGGGRVRSRGWTGCEMITMLIGITGA